MWLSVIPVRELEKVVMPDRETVTPSWEHMKIYLIPERDTCRLFITFINDIASCSMAFSIPCSVIYSRHIRDALHYTLALRRDFSHNALRRYFTKNPLLGAM